MEVPASIRSRHQHQRSQHQQEERPNVMAAENHQLRQERDLLMQKLLRSKNALKETLDRLGASDNGGHGNTNTSSSKANRSSAAMAAAAASEDPPATSKRSTPMTSANVLQSVGGQPSRARVTQDLREFSHVSERRRSKSGRSSRHQHHGKQ